MARSWEWDCPHGVGHPKPEAKHQVHGCDGCCDPEKLAGVCDDIIQRNHEAPDVRQFATGAKRSADHDRIDPEGFLSPLVIERFSAYLHKHRTMPDGSQRESDNWQKGMPLATYMKGAWRHLLHWWTRHRGFPVTDPKAAANIEEDLCALIFNASGYLHEILKARVQHSPPYTPREHRAIVNEEFLHNSF